MPINNTSFFIYLAVMAGSSYLIRAISFAAMRKKIENKFIRSFLYYIPYAVLAVMTVPAIFYAAENMLACVAGFAVAAVLAWRGKSLLQVAAAACATVLAVSLLL